MDETGESGQQQPSADSQRVTCVFAITFPDFFGMLEKQLIQHIQYLLNHFGQPIQILRTLAVSPASNSILTLSWRHFFPYYWENVI